MKKLTVLMIVIFLFMMASSLTAQEKPRIGVLRFTNNTNSSWWWGASTARELADMLSAELVEADAFQVLERKEIDAVIREQDLSASGAVSKNTLVKMGRIKGAKYLVAATVSAFEGNQSGEGGGVRVGGLRLGGKKEKAYLAVDLKVIDSETSEIVDAFTIEATSKSKGISVGVSTRYFGGDLGKYEKTPVGKAIRACIVYMSEYLSCTMVDGKDAPCYKKWEKYAKKRRAKTKSAIDLE
jgi:curli biogenesis system outer membrane secretion channel CsgG